MEITTKQIREFVDTFEWFREPAKQGYLEAAIDRLAHTLNAMPRLPDAGRVRVLEIGGIPYFMTALIQRFLGYQVECANEPTWKTDKERNVEILVNDAGERYEIPWKALNIEYDRWPWEDGSFDIVLYCEVIEHLTYDPTHSLVEAHRVLRPGSGQLLLSTPNALAWQYAVEVLHGRNPYPPYSGYNMYARHHRLFTTDELAYLCREVGFEVDKAYSTRDLSYWHPPRWERLARLADKAGWLRGRQDVIYVLATAKGTPRYVYPDSSPYPIYADVHAYPARGTPSVIVMSDTAAARFGQGFYKLEQWGGGVRWTGEEAQAVLVNNGEGKASATFFTGSTQRGPTVRGAIAVSNEDGTVVERQAFEVTSGVWETVTVAVPDGIGDRVRVTLTVDNPMVPSELDAKSKDDRRLGVAVREIGLR